MDTLWRIISVYPSTKRGWKEAFDSFEWDYEWTDMGGYYLNSIHFVGAIGIQYPYPGDGEVMFKLTEVKGYPIMKGYSYANSYMGTEDEYTGVEGYDKTQLLNNSRYMTETTLRLDKDGNVIPGFRAFSNGFNNNPTKNMRYPTAQGEKYRGQFFFISKKTND